jgi:ankyrin
MPRKANVLLVAITTLPMMADAAPAAQPSPPAFVPGVIVINDVPMVPARYGPFGMVEYDAVSKRITIWRSLLRVVVKHGNTEARALHAGGRKVVLPMPPMLWQGVTYVPLSLAKEFFWTVTWDAARGVATLTREDWGHVTTLTLVRMDLPLLAAQRHDLEELGRLVRANPEFLEGRDPSSQYTLLHWAAARGDVPVMRVLLAAGADVNAAIRDERDERRADVGLTPLHVATQAGNVEAVRFLLRHGAQLQGRDTSDNTPLHLACQAGDAPMAALLLEAGAEVSARNGVGNQPVHLAAGTGDAALLRLLLQHGASAIIAGQYDYVPLHRAAAIGSPGAVELLLARGTNVAITDCSGRTPLHWAARNGHLTTAKLLLARGARVNSQGLAPLHLAAEHGQLAMVRFLLDRGAVVTAADRDGKTALHFAAEHGYRDMAKLLIARGASPDAVDGEGRSPLHVAAQSGQTDVAQVLLDAGADMRMLSRQDGTPLHLAALTGRLEMVRLLLARRAPVDANDAWIGTPLMAAVRHWPFHLLDEAASEQLAVQIATVLLDAGANVNARSRGGKTALHYAARDGYHAIARMLLARGADVNAADQGGGTPLHEAADRAQTNLATLLLDHGANLEARDRQGHTPLQLVGGGWDYRRNAPAMARLLVERGAHPSLHQAAVMSDPDLMRRLIAEGADVNARDEMRRTPLHWVLLWEARGSGGDVACEAVRVLLAAGADPEIKDRLEDTALEVTRPTAVDLFIPLVEAGADPNVSWPGSCDSPLHAAVRAGRLDVVELLVEKRADVNAENRDGHSPLWEAMQGNHQEIAAYLRAHGGHE